MRTLWIIGITIVLLGCDKNECWVVGGFGNMDSSKCQAGRVGDFPAAMIVNGTFEEDWGCGICGDARVLKNYTDKHVQASLVEQRWHTFGKPGWRYERKSLVNLHPRERRYLGCTGASEVHGTGCEIAFAWHLDGPPRVIGTNDQLLPLAIAALRFVRTANYTPATNCKKLCDERSPFCIGFRMPIDISEGISKAATAFYTSSGEVAMRELLSAFNIQDDPCERLPITIGGDQLLQNSGKACWLTALVGQSQNDQITTAIEIPERITAQRSKAGTELTLRFDDADSAPRLSIDNTALNDDWGGRLISVSWDGKSITAQTTKGCIRANY